MAHLFLSYSRRDAHFVDAVTADLKNNGFRIWVDRSGISGGDQWRKEIVDAIQSANVVVLFLSPNSARSDNVRKEIDLAEGARVPILPVALAPTEIPSTLKYQLAGVQIIDVWSDYAAGVASLVRTLSRAGAAAQSQRENQRRGRPVVGMSPAEQAPDLASLGGRNLIDSFGLGWIFRRGK
jgi:hypothetical protein